MPPKKKDSPENKIDNLDKKTDERFDHLEKYIFKEVCRLDNKIDSLKEEMNDKFDKVLSAVSNLVVTTEGIKQEVTAIGEYIRRHDKLEILS